MRLPGLILSLFICCSLLISSVGSAPIALSQTNAQTCDATRQRTVIVSALTKAGLPFDNLRAEDVGLSENKSPREILALQNRSSEPLAIAVMIDTSVSQESSLSGTKLAAKAFIEKTLRNDRHRVALVSFTNEATVEQDFTNDETKLRTAIDRVKIVAPAGYYRGGLVVGRPPPKQNFPGATALWDAVWSAADDFNNNAVERRAIVVLTDGDDTNSRRKMRDAIAHAAAANIAVFSIGIAGTYTLDRTNLRKLSEETGGLAFFPKKISELDNVFEQITASLQSQYTLNYCSDAPMPAGKPSKLQITIKNPALVQANLQLSYPRYIF